MKKLTLIAAILLGSLTAHANTITNFYSTFTSATPEEGTLVLAKRTSVSGGFLILGEDGNANNAASATATATLASFELTDVVLKLDWVQVSVTATTMAVANDNGDILFSLVTDENRNLSWNGNGQSVAVGSLSTGSTSIQIDLNTDDSINLLVGGTSYGTGLALNNFAKNVSSIEFARGNAKGITANFDNVLVESIPEPAVASLVILFGTGVLFSRRIFTK